MLEYISSDLDFDLDHPLPISFQVLLLSPPQTPRSPIRPPFKSPVVRCSLLTPPLTPQPPIEPRKVTKSYQPPEKLSFRWPPAALGGGSPLVVQALPPIPNPPSTRPDLDVNDRAQMDDLMTMECSEEHCAMAAEVVGIIIPVVHAPTAPEAEKLKASTDQAAYLSRAFARWTQLSRHPLCTLISSMVLLERLFALHPQFNSAAIQPDTFLRLSFASFLIAIKAHSEGSAQNAGFVRHTPWNLESINMMEKEFLHALNFDVYVSSAEFLHRALGFWTSHLQAQQHQQLQARRASAPDLTTTSLSLPTPPIALPPPPSIGNLFLAQRRSGVEEKRWKGGIVHSPRASGRRLSEVLGEDQMQTVWKDGRLERTERWRRPTSAHAPKKGKGTKLKKEESSRGRVRVPSRRDSF